MNNDKLITKLGEIKALVDECLAVLSDDHEPKHKTVTKQETKKSVASSDYILEIVNKIKNCAEAKKIESNILDKVGMPGRILLPFFICYKYFPEQKLTTGDIEKITSELRVRVRTPNVSNAIANSLQKYLDGNSTRVRGKAVSYKLNRKGAKYFETILNSNEEK